jgi:hypothetical protein
MKKNLPPVLCAVLFFLAFGLASLPEAAAQNRKSVSAAEVNGTFRSNFTGRFKGSYNEIKILALGRGRMKVSFDLIYTYVTGNGELSANIGSAEGEATIVGDTAVFSSGDNYGNCKITIKFVKPGLINVTQESFGSDCDFGHNVTANGTYKKTSGAKPKF